MKKADHRNIAIWLVVVGMGIAMVGCAGKKKLITTHGIHGIRLGQEMPEWGMDEVNGMPAEDTLFTEGEFSWRVTKLNMKKGHVFVEEDFYNSGQVSRIRVETPELRLRNGTHVGMAVKDLAKLKQHWYISPIPNYNLWNFYSREYPRVNFVVDDPNKSMEIPDGESWEGFQISEFNQEALIKIIVVY